MAKFLIIICALFAISMAETFDRDAAIKAVDDRALEKARARKLEDAKYACVMSINQAIRDLSFSDKGPHTPEIQQELLKIYRPAHAKLLQLNADAIYSKTMDVTSEMKTNSGNIINCKDEIAKKVVKITNDALAGYERFLCTGVACDKFLTVIPLLPTATSQNGD